MADTLTELLSAPFANHADLIAAYARERPDAIAVVDDDGALGFGALDRLVDALAARLQREGVGRGGAVAIAGLNSIGYVAVFLAALRVGAAAAPLTSSATAEALGAMAADSGARHLFADTALAMTLPPGVERIDLARLSEWTNGHTAPSRVEVLPADPFNIIYSSGTTGSPKGIVQSHAMRWAYLQRALPLGYGVDSVTMIATPLYSNTTLVAALPALVAGGRVILTRKFDAARYLATAERERATHTMLVPVQYRRIMADPSFDARDLTSFRVKCCTSAPFPPELKRDVLTRWPGGLIEFYGMTEGGASTMLLAHEHPDKLHTVGRPAPGSDIRLIGSDDREVPPGDIGEVVGRGPMMMSGYHNRTADTQAAQWRAPDGTIFMRQGDIARFDQDGFLILMDRTKDVIISGGFNVFPSDLEAALASLPHVVDCAVVGVPDDRWGETPVAVAVLRAGSDPDAVLVAANATLGKSQRIARIEVVDALPRSAIGKVLKRELRDRLVATASTA